MINSLVFLGYPSKPSKDTLVCKRLTIKIGIGLTCIFTPLAAEMFDAVTLVGKSNQRIFGPAGAYARAYGLFNAVQGLGTILGPVLAGLLYAKAGWTITVLVLAAFCVSGAILIVSCDITCQIITLREKLL